MVMRTSIMLPTITTPTITMATITITSTLMTIITTSIMITTEIITEITSATTMEFIKAGEYIRHGAGSQDGIVTKYEHILLSSLIMI